MATRPHRPTPPRRAILAVLPALAFSLALSTSATAQPTHLAQDWAQPPAGFVPQDSLRDHLTRLRAALLALKDSPEIAQPLVLRAHVTAEGRSGVRRLQIRNFQFLSDGPPAVGEFNLGPGSWPTVVGVLGSAVAEEFLTQAALKGIPLDELEIVFTGRPSAGPASSGGSRVTYPRNLAYTAYIVSPAADAELEELRATVERVSPVLRLVTEPQPIAHGTLVLTPTPAERGAKTLEGCAAFVAAGFAGAMALRLVMPAPNGYAGACALAAAVAGAAELFSKRLKIDDNLTVSIAAGLTLFLSLGGR